MIRQLLRTAQKARQRSSRELWTRAAQRALAFTERAQLLVGDPSSMRASEPVGDNVAPPFFAGLTSVERTMAALRAAAPDDEAATLARAARIAAGDVPVLGHGWLTIGAAPDWHREPLANVRAPVRHWSRIDYLDAAIVGDHKVLWEFNRHQFLTTLGQAWRYSRDERWAAACGRYLTSWLEQNPPRVGVNWASSLEVGYRAISWCWAAHLFADATSVDVRALASRSIDAHARHVARYLSTYFSPNTHLTGEALGLFYVGVTFPELSGASRWRALGAQVLEDEIARQVLGDGVYFEQATQYHRYTAEIYLHFLLLAQAAGEPRGAHVTGAVHRLFDVLLALTRTDGTMPLIGDDDGGKLVQLDADEPHALRELLSAGAVALDRPDLARAGAGAARMATWLCGPDALTTLAELRTRGSGTDADAGSDASATASRAFPRGGLYVVRDSGSRGAGHAVIDAGPHGALSHGHSHADALSLNLFAGNGPLFVDAGTFTYVGAERDAYRTTAAHNTAEISGESASLPGSSFRWRSTADGHCDSWVAEDGLTWFSGHHDGYARLDVPATHVRDIVHPASGVWVVDDRLETLSAHEMSVRWHLAPDVVPAIREPAPGVFLVELARDGQHVATLAMHGNGGTVGLEPGRVSSQFGRSEPTTVVRWHGRVTRDVPVLSIVLDWTSLPVDALVALHLPGDIALECMARESGGPDAGPRGSGLALHVRDGASEHGEALRVDARLAWAEAGPDGVTQRVAAVGVRDLSLQGAAASFEGNGWFVASRVRGEWAVRSGTLSPLED